MRSHVTQVVARSKKQPTPPLSDLFNAFPFKCIRQPKPRRPGGLPYLRPEAHEPLDRIQGAICTVLPRPRFEAHMPEPWARAKPRVQLSGADRIRSVTSKSLIALM
jgi:hypothetical protein